MEVSLSKSTAADSSSVSGSLNATSTPLSSKQWKMVCCVSNISPRHRNKVHSLWNTYSNLQASFRFPFSSSATTFGTSCFLQNKPLKHRIMPKSGGCNLLAQFAGKKFDTHIRQRQIRMCAALVNKSNYFTILQIYFFVQFAQKIFQKSLCYPRFFVCFVLCG